jgi:very-short-patch-repair endonuclease
MHVRAEKLLRSQDSCVAVWQLRAAGLHEEAIATLVRRWRWVHDGVYLASFGAPTVHQCRLAATLTTPTSVLSRFSAAGCWDIREYDGLIQSITRPGTTGLRRTKHLVVHHSTKLEGDVTTRNGIPITTPERTIIDLWPALADQQRRKMVREALRLRRITISSLNAALQKHQSRRGTAALRTITSLYSLLQLERCRSDAEAYAMESLAMARRELPDVNREINGHCADLSWPAHKLIIEIDGPQFHRDKLEDAHKTSGWVTAGWTVRRIPSDGIFEHPDRLLALAPCSFPGDANPGDRRDPRPARRPQAPRA